MSTDLAALARLLAPTQRGARFGTAIVATVDAVTGTCQIIPALGVGNLYVTAARYLCDAPPRPQSTVWTVSDGADLLVMGALAPDNGPPSAKINKSGTQSIANNTTTAVAFDTIVHDPWFMWNGFAPSRITAPATGLYQVCAASVWPTNATGIRQLFIGVNGAGVSVARESSPSSGNGVYMETEWQGVLAAGDYVEALVHQTSGGSLNANADSYAPALSVTWLGHRKPAQLIGPEILSNPGFEAATDFDGWDLGWAAGSFAIDASTHSGTKAAKATMPAGQVCSIVSDSFVVTPGENYDVTWYMKTGTALAGTGTNGQRAWLLCAPTRVGANYFGTDSNIASSAMTDGATTTGYTSYGKRMTIPAGCHYARLAIGAYSSIGNSAWWDDCSVKLSARY